MKDDGCGSFLLGETACPGTVHRVRGGDGASFSVSPYTDAAQ